MSTSQHRTSIDVDLNTEAAEGALKRLQEMADRLTASLRGGGGLSPSAGGGAPNVPPGGSPGGGGAPGALPGGGGGSGGALPPAPAPSASPGGSPSGAPSPGAPAPSGAPGGGSPGGGAGPTPGGAPGAGPGGSPGGGPAPAPNPRPGEDPRSGMRGPYMGAGAGILAIAARHDLSMSSLAAREQQAGLSAAGDTSIAAPFSLAAQQQQLMGARDATASRAIGGSLTAGAGLAAGLAFGGPAGMAVAAIGGALTELFATRQEQEGATKAAALGAAGQAISFRAQVAGRRANFDQQNAMLGMYGRGIGPGSGVGLGLLPEESMAAMMGFAGAAGFEGALDGQQVLRMSRSTVGIGTAGAFRGLGAAGAGGTGNVNPAAFIGLAQQSDLMGSKADEYLSRIASATSSLAEQGLHLDIGETDKFLRMLSGAEGAGNYSGLAQSRAVGQLTGSAAGARGRLLAPYAGMTENAVLMQALQSGGGSTMGSLRAIEGIMSSPTRIAGATMGTFGGMAPLGFAAEGMSSDVAQAVAGMSPDRMTSPRMRAAGGSGLAVARARAQAGLMNEIKGFDVGIFEAEAQIQKRVMGLGFDALALIDNLTKAMGKLHEEVIKVIGNTSF